MRDFDSEFLAIRAPNFASRAEARACQASLEKRLAEAAFHYAGQIAAPYRAAATNATAEFSPAMNALLADLPAHTASTPER